MTTRERHLLMIVASVLGVGLFGFVAYSLVISPLLEKNKQIKLREAEVAQLDNDIADIVIMKQRFETERQKSLPADPITGVSLSRTQYSNLLETLLRRADYAPGSFKILVGDPDTKSAPAIAPKKPAYTKLGYELTLKGELYHLVDFMQSFYQQPLLHTIKKINIIRPSDSRAQGQRQLDVTMSIEALVLDNAVSRGTLLPIVREVALVASPAAFAGMNVKAVTEGRGSPLAPPGVLAESQREYLSIDGKNVFFGARPIRPDRGPAATPAEDDHSPFVTLTSIVGHDDGKIVAVFRDKLDNHNYIITQDAKGTIGVYGEYELASRDPESAARGPAKMLAAPGYSKTKQGNVLFFGTDEGQNRREWRIRRVLLDAVIIEKVEAPDPEAKPKPNPLGAIGGGAGAFVAVPEGKVYRVGMGQTLDAEPRGFTRPATAPTKFALTREAWKDIFAPLMLPTSATSE